MPVKVVVDSSAGLPKKIARGLDIEVVDLHMVPSEKEEESPSTSGLTAIELAALYGRLMERSRRPDAGGDGKEDGVVALHLSKELSSTWSAATTAAGVFDDSVRLVDTGSAGMAVGAAAMSAARLAQDGASVDECYDIAVDTLERARTWVYLDSTEELRRSGRLSTATAVFTTALLATKPIMSMQSGRPELVGKTRTQSKAFAKLVDLVAAGAGEDPAFIAIQHNDARADADNLRALLEDALPSGTLFIVVPLSKVLGVHVGPGAIAVSAVYSAPPEDKPKGKQPSGFASPFGTKRAER